MIDLLSIAMVTDDGREYYAVSSEFDASRVDDWVSMHVLPHIDWSLARPRAQIRHELHRFLTDAQPSAFWGYTPAYDWVATMQLIGPLSDWKAAGWPHRCFDLKQEHIRRASPSFLRIRQMHIMLSRMRAGTARSTTYCVSGAAVGRLPHRNHVLAAEVSKR